MAISRVNPDWGFGSKLGSADLDAIEDNITYALDKRSGETDTLASDVTVTGETAFEGETAFNGVVSFDAGVTFTADASLTVAGPASFSAAADFSGATTFNSDVTLDGVQLIVDGGSIVLDSGYPELDAAHTGKTITRRINGRFMVSGAMAIGAFKAAFNSTVISYDDAKLTYSPSGLHKWQVTSGVTTTQSALCISDCLTNGATVNTVTMTVKGDAALGALPALKPGMELVRVDSAGNVQSLSSGGDVIASPASLADYKAGVVVTFTCDQNNVVDKSLYLYVLIVHSEGAMNSVVGQQFYGLSATQTISDLRPH